MTKGLKTFIFLSVALNLFLGMLLLGHWFNHPDRLEEENEASVMASLPPEARTAMEEAIAARNAYRQQHKESMREARKRIRSLLEAETFDEAAFRAELERIHVLKDGMRETLQEEVIEAAKVLPIAQRPYLLIIMRPHHKAYYPGHEAKDNPKP